MQKIFVHRSESSRNYRETLQVNKKTGFRRNFLLTFFIKI